MSDVIHDLARWLRARLAEEPRDDLTERQLLDLMVKDQIIGRYEALSKGLRRWQQLGAHTATAEATVFAYEQVVRLLALPYAGQPGYEKKWRP